MNNIKKTILNSIKIIIIDVDGTMTDGGIYYDEQGNELKKFSAKDAAGFFAAHKCGIKIIVLTGRECNATEKRMKELKVDYFKQNIQNKVEYLKIIAKENNISYEEIAYIGDDLNDYAAMKLVGFVGCPNDACREIIKIADFVSSIEGGKGAVRDVIEYMLKERGEWDKVVSQIFGIGV